MSEASNFVAKRKQPLSVGQKNIENILWYILECYNMILSNKKTYSLSKINKSKIKPENYLRNKFVDEYLREYTHLFQNKFNTQYIYFDKDSEETCVDQDNNEYTDKIDIYIRNKALQESWSQEKNVYFALECKRIDILSDTQKYIDEDTLGKFIERKHIGFRLPYEGQLAFVQQKKNTSRKVADEINNRLSNNDKTKKHTIDSLNSIKINEVNDCVFMSKHVRDYSKKEFVIYHLLLDYSDIVVN